MPPENDFAANPAAALAWLIEMGADEAVGDMPVDRFSASPSSAIPPSPIPPRQGEGKMEGSSPARSSSMAPFPSPSPLMGEGRDGGERRSSPPATLIPRPAGEDPVADARALAAACRSLGDIAAALRDFTACPLQRTATNLVYLDGNPEARVLFVGEAPGRDEDLQGKPFVGRSGQLLDRMLGAIGLSRRSEDPESAALITNVIYWRPPGNRKPTEAETLTCMPFVVRTIELMAPEIIVCLGATPAQRLLGLADGILKLRGRWRSYPSGGREVPLLPTLHPAYLLRQPQQKRLAWRDLLALRKALDGKPNS